MPTKILTIICLFYLSLAPAFSKTQRSADISQTCGLKLMLKPNQKIKLKPLLTQAEAQAIPAEEFSDGAIYYNQNEDVYEIFEKTPYPRLFLIACQNRHNGQEYIADGWAWYSLRQKAIKPYSSEQLSKIVPWDIFKNPEFIKNVKNLRGIVVNKNFISGSEGDYSNTFYLLFEYKGRKYRFDGSASQAINFNLNINY